MNKTRYIISKRRHYISPAVQFEEMEGECMLGPNSIGATGGHGGQGEGSQGETTNPLFPFPGITPPSSAKEGEFEFGLDEIEF